MRGERSNLTHGPHKKACRKASRAVGEVELESSRRKPAVCQGSSPVEGSRGRRSAAKPAMPRRTAGQWRKPERSRQPVTERSEVIEPRDDPSRRGGTSGLLERASTLKEQRPVRSSEASSARPEPPGRTAGPGPTKSRGANCRVDETTRVAPASHHEGGR